MESFDFSVSGFDATQAIERSSFSNFIKRNADQHLLDISARSRVSSLPWKGQFSPQLVEYLLSKYGFKGAYVLDPFCGSGTVLRESLSAGLNAMGMDVNPAAVCLARVSSLSCVNNDKHQKLTVLLKDFYDNLLAISLRNNGALSIASAVECYNKLQLDVTEKIMLEGYLLFVFSDAKEVKSTKLNALYSRYSAIALSAHGNINNMSVTIGDARNIPANNNVFDYLLTSPPYINVFNYHQNYRPIIEGLGYEPLCAARSEIGANRKFRQNRYMTVIQYCMDMAQFFSEANRVIKSAGVMTIIVGRESNVRAVRFMNSELVGAIALEGMGFELLDWSERKFINRYGDSIYEDVITMRPNYCDNEKAISIAKSVGIQALRNALDYCPTERVEEINSAIESSAKIFPSPLIKSSI